MVFQKSFKSVSIKFHGYFTKVSRLFQGRLKGVSRKIEGCFKGDFSGLKEVQRNFRKVSKVF